MTCVMMFPTPRSSPQKNSSFVAAICSSWLQLIVARGQSSHHAEDVAALHEARAALRLERESLLLLAGRIPSLAKSEAPTPSRWGAQRGLPRHAGGVYKKRAGIFNRHHDDTMMRDENRAKKCKKYLILLNKCAGVVQW
jgi:hypothetical protein